PLALLSGAVLLAGMLTACDEGGSSGTTTRDVPISAQVLDSAASFLGAATGKESPLIVDDVVFINSALGLNDVPRDALDLYGDLWVVVRDAYGVPVLDANGCVQPVASEPVVWPDGSTQDTVPMMLEEFMDGEFKCTPVEGYEQYTVELEIGRLNMVRTMSTNPTVFARALQEAIKNINAASSVKTDAAGRLVLVSEVDGLPVEKTIDSPRENLALYYALLKHGRIAGYGPESRGEEGEVIPPQWLEIRPDLDLGALAYLRDGTFGREGGVDLYKGYADLSVMTHNRQEDYQTRLVSYVQYVDDGSGCYYQDREDYVWPRVFGEEAYYGENIAGFTQHADDARATIVFMHNVIQDVPEEMLATLPVIDDGVNPPYSRLDLMEAAAAFIGAASNKGVPLTVDGLVFVNTVLGLNEVEFSYKGEIYGDLWELLRNDNGEPVLDANSCPQPISSDPVATGGDYVPMELDDQGECVIVAGYEDYVIELELGRLNGVRVALTNPAMLDRALYDVVNSINASTGVKLDLAGRLAFGVDEDGDGGADRYQTVDSPRANLAMYYALMRWGKLEGTVEIMEDGTWVTKTIQITLDDAVLDAEGLGYLKRGTTACQGNPDACGSSRLPGGYVDYSAFTHNAQEDFQGVDVSYVERTPDDLSCGYADRTSPLWERVLGSDAADYANIAGFVVQAENTRNIIQFVHTVIQNPVTEPAPE
ncbi:MAG: hypothetical protein LPK43_06000, partial [Gammaproteobacteria bacterium]|nr:hypothetical protein [Gammaproteobacteria bacterium]